MADGLPNLALPKSMSLLDAPDGEADVVVSMSVGNLDVPVPSGPARLHRGGMEAFGNQDRLVWVHKDIGPVIDIHPRGGRVEARLPSWGWTRTTDLFDQLMLPSLLPVFAARGLRAFHASAVKANGVGVFFAGPSGSGKTTTALLLISNVRNSWPMTCSSCTGKRENR
jgi:hypothetical protein